MLMCGYTQQTADDEHYKDAMKDLVRQDKATISFEHHAKFALYC